MDLKNNRIIIETPTEALDIASALKAAEGGFHIGEYTSLKRDQLPYTMRAHPSAMAVRGLRRLAKNETTSVRLNPFRANEYLADLGLAERSAI